MLLSLFLSPVLMLIVAAIVVIYARLTRLRKAPLDYLIGRSVAFAVAGAALTLLCTIGWMIWYENTTGYSAGNAPLGWIFFYGPLSAACGQFVALLMWWFKSVDRDSPVSQPML